MITAKLRRTGNSIVVTIPKDELERLGVGEGDLVGIDVRRVEVRPVLPDDVREAFEAELPKARVGLKYLAGR
jgi:putative addiction module antidote